MPTLTMNLNGEEVYVEIEADDLLVYVLRDKLGLIGTKISCGEGECGACTVIVDSKAVDSCLFPAMKAHGRRVETIDGLKKGRQFHVIQEAFIEKTASQCGYCTPGMIMAAKALLDETPHPTYQEIKEAISGNLCRCTGYYQIVEAIKLAAERLYPAGSQGEGKMNRPS